jgi:hypothetical protein
MSELMNFMDFLTAADAALKRSLDIAGFRRMDPGTWTVRKGDDLNIIWLQKHSVQSLFCVNLGIHYAFLPKTSTETPVTGDYVEQPDCEIKLRLNSEPSVKDQWWPIVPEAADEVANLVSHRGLAIFDSYRLEGPISAVESKDIEAGNLGILSSLTKVRACLLLARIHERLGNRAKRVDAATIGIKLAGMAVGPKKALKDILKRNGESA